MRILANYSCRNNGGENFQVTFETSGDTPVEQANAVVDDLFALAKAAIQRQINPAAQPVATPEGVTIPQPVKSNNGNGNGNGKYTNGNGNGKPHPKESEAPISAKQQSLLLKLSKEKGQRIEGLHAMSMSSASEKIKELLAA